MKSLPGLTLTLPRSIEVCWTCTTRPIGISAGRTRRRCVAATANGPAAGDRFRGTLTQIPRFADMGDESGPWGTPRRLGVRTSAARETADGPRRV
ncbi:unnamed protein product, partial [Iphiclides podalirius]